MTLWRRIKDLATAAFVSLVMFLIVLMPLSDLPGGLPAVASWVTTLLGEVLLIVFGLAIIPVGWIICKIAESSEDNSNIVFGTIFIVSTVFMALVEFGVF